MFIHKVFVHLYLRKTSDMGNLKKNTKMDNNDDSKLDNLKKEKVVKKKSDHSLRLVEVSDEELKRLRIDVYPYLM